MEKYKQLLNKLKQQDAINQLLTHLTSHRQSIQQLQLISPTKSQLHSYLLYAINKSQSLLPLHRMIQFLYQQHSKLIQIIFQFIPHFIIKFIVSEHKMQGLDECILAIYNHEINYYNKEGQRRQQMISSMSAQQLYQTHINKPLATIQWHYLNAIPSVSINNRNHIVSVFVMLEMLMLWVWYSKLSDMSDISVEEYLTMVYMQMYHESSYCGGSEKETDKGVSLYLLEKKNPINMFKFSISEEEAEWMLLSLYDLAIQRQNYKYEILAAISMIHKKAANECQFRLSEIAQSVLHLLEDQYADIF